MGDETADERRARLRALRKDAGRETSYAAPDADAAPDANAAPEVTFRNYVPRDDALARGKLPAATAPAPRAMGDRDDEDGDATTTTTEGLALEPNVGDVDPSMLAPRRANWDLKRDVEPKLEKLERRTQRALVDIAREEERKRAAA